MSDDDDSQLEHQKKEDRIAFNHGLDNNKGAEEVGQIARNSQSHETVAAGEKKNKNKKAKGFHDLIHQIEQARKNLQEMKDLIDQRIEEIRIERYQIAERMQKLTQRMVVINNAIEKFNVIGEFQLNEHGELANPKLEATIREWENENDKTVERDNFGLIEQILLLKSDAHQMETENLKQRDKNLEVEEKEAKVVRRRLEEVDEKLVNGDTNAKLEVLERIPEFEKTIRQTVLEENSKSKLTTPSSSHQTQAVNLTSSFDF